MNYYEEVEKIDKAIHHLKTLKKELLETQKKSKKAFECVGTVRQRDKTTVGLNWQCMALDKQRKTTWKAIIEADLEVSLEDCEYNPSGWHSYKHQVK